MSFKALKKEKRSGDPTVVDIFESGGGLCPIKAFKKWKVKAVPTEKLPLFRHSNGTPLTGRKFNEYLRQMLGKHASFAQGTILADGSDNWQISSVCGWISLCSGRTSSCAWGGLAHG